MSEPAWSQVPGQQEEAEGEGGGDARHWDQLPVHLALHDGRPLSGQRDRRPAEAVEETAESGQF